jgi:transposase InsO family protein
VHPLRQRPRADRQCAAGLVPLRPGGHQLHRARFALANLYVESFGGRLLAVEAFTTLLEAQVLVEDWRIEYNTVRPHSALGYLTPAEYAKAWTATHPELS